MSIAGVGSPLWLLRHELRLAWRGVGGRRFWLVLVVGTIMWATLHAAVWALLREAGHGDMPARITPIFGGIAWLAIMLMLSQSILLSVSALFDRGDLDLLLASPMPARTVFFVRGLGIALNCSALYVFLFTPFAHVGLFTGHLALLAIYPTLAALALLAGSLGMLLTLTLVRLLGARRARTVAQVVGAVTGALFFLLSQLQNVLGAQTRAGLVRTFERWSRADGLLGPDAVVWFPFRAATGDKAALLALAASGVACFWLVTTLAYRRFLTGTQETVTGSAVRLVPARRPVARFRAGLWRTVLVKEWKLVARDPMLLTQTLMQALYLLPVVFVVLRRDDMAVLAVPAAVALAASLAGGFAWITVAAEDAPELIGAAPVALSRIRWMKVIAALVPVWLLVSPLSVFLLATRPVLGAVFIACLAGATVSAGMTQLWYPRQGDRRDMKKRSKSGGLVSVLEMLTGLGWSGIAWCLIHGRAALLPVGMLLAMTGPAAAWFLGRERREQGLLV